MNQNQQDSLYCGEGNQLRNRPSIKVRQVPGGGSSYNFITGVDANDRQNLSSSHSSSSQMSSSPPQSSNRPGKKSQEVTGKIGGATTQNQQPQYSYNPQQPHVSRQSNQESAALYCTEGNQVRTRPSVRVAQQKKDQITF
ncbi:hypothetical protein NAEGRDRAFT_79216 [Naegleria gruberi]|uniref:Uncharacterized protein n=1 Tax=Naegleria gruberi TaxID=5762 RepID=D2VAH4_NAEGR|nr:uncharacterized protein NAEGRDRAFT_79216 [Naegleria gruberi]EFC45957.1 hypothetical protein NAEGRDRAFT_79216 [Naegleria gruberi]|eukprot:XP_002678701.1 hypothetical protein NAEGRDRAFT_79216 [Naegleria gruberi strain NEG-M]